MVLNLQIAWKVTYLTYKKICNIAQKIVRNFVSSNHIKTCIILINVSTYMLIFSALGEYLIMRCETHEKLIGIAKNYISNAPLDVDIPVVDHAYVLNGCVCMYKMTKDKAYFDYVIRYLDSVIMQKEKFLDKTYDNDENGLSLFDIGIMSDFAFDETGEDKYKEFSGLIYEKLSKFLKSDDSSVKASSLKNFQNYMPFYTDYETRWNKKNGYNDICDRFRDAFELVNNDKERSIGLSDKILFLKSVVDCLSVLSIQIYEDYRLLEDILRQGIENLFFKNEDFEKVLELEDKDIIISAYILLKSIQEGHISSEKYKALADSLFEKAFDPEENSDHKDAGYTGALMMATAFSK